MSVIVVVSGVKAVSGIEVVLGVEAVKGWRLCRCSNCFRFTGYVGYRGSAGVEAVSGARSGSLMLTMLFVCTNLSSTATTAPLLTLPLAAPNHSWPPLLAV